MREIMDRQLGRVRRGWRRLIGEDRSSLLVQRMRKISYTIIIVLDRSGCGVSDITNLTHGMMMTLPIQLVTNALSAPLLIAKSIQHVHFRIQGLQLDETRSDHYCVCGGKHLYCSLLGQRRQEFGWTRYISSDANTYSYVAHIDERSRKLCEGNI
jgi:hypothetical protein